MGDTGWGYWFLFGDAGQQVSLQDHAHRLQALRRSLGRKGRTDASQNQRLDDLERELLMLGAGLSALVEVVRDKQLASMAEIQAAIERNTGAAEAAAAQAKTEQEDADRRQQKARRAKARTRRRRDA